MKWFIVAIFVILMFLAVSGSFDSDDNKITVFCIGKNIFRYVAAKDICLKLGGRLAKVNEVQNACKGKDWHDSDTLGWCDDHMAVTCRNNTVKAGKVPGHLKLGIYCVGFKPQGKIAKELLIH